MAQSDTTKKETFTVVEQMPEFPGGIKEMMKFIQQNIRYPQEMRGKLMGGKVFVKFVVDISGKIRNVEVIKSSGFIQLDEEAIRVVSSMPIWTPGKQKGEDVNVYFNIPIVFSLSADRPYFVCNVSNKNSHYKGGISSMLASNYSSAIDEFETCLKENPNDVDALYDLGVIFYINKKNKDACKNFNGVIEKSTDDKSTIVKNCKTYLEKYCN